MVAVSVLVPLVNVACTAVDAASRSRWCRSRNTKLALVSTKQMAGGPSAASILARAVSPSVPSSHHHRMVDAPGSRSRAPPGQPSASRMYPIAVPVRMLAYSGVDRGLAWANRAIRSRQDRVTVRSPRFGVTV